MKLETACKINPIKRRTKPISINVSPCPIISPLSKFKERRVFFVVDSHLKASAKDSDTADDVKK
jgi:hypothetical protein